MPKISVLIPTYNSAKYISDAIESVLAQAYSDYEIIIVDDGSTDNTAEVVKKFSLAAGCHRPEIRYIYQENKGPGAARNKGISEARGEYIAFIDADDTLADSSLGKRIEYLDKYKDVDLIFTDHYIIDSDKKLVAPRLKEKGFLEFFSSAICTKHNDGVIFNDKFYELFFRFSPYPIWMGTVMLRKSIITEVGLFRTDISIAEDTDFWIRVIKNHRIGYIDEALSYYNRSTQGLTRNTERYYKDCITFYRSLFATSENKIIKNNARHNIDSAYFELAYHYRRNFKLKALKHLIKSLSINPMTWVKYKLFISILLPNIFCKKEIYNND